MKFYRVSALILACTCLGGCSFTTVGQDHFEPINEGIVVYENDEHLGTLLQDFVKPTSVIREVDNFINFIDKEKWEEALGELGYSSGELLSPLDVRQWASTNIAGRELKSRAEQGAGENKSVRLTFTEGDAVVLKMVKVDALWKVQLPDFLVDGAELCAPKGYSIKLGSVDLKEFRVDTGEKGIDVYKLPVVSKYAHTYTLENSFGSPLSCNLILEDRARGTFDTALRVKKPLRTEVISAVGQLVTSLNSALVSNKYSDFKKLFASDVDLSLYDTTYKRGVEAKSPLREFQFVECKDIALSDDAVVFTGRDTVKATVGTSWKWKTVVDEVAVWQTMKIVTTMEVKKENKAWKIVSLDDTSFVKVSVGASDWSEML